VFGKKELPCRASLPVKFLLAQASSLVWRLKMLKPPYYYVYRRAHEVASSTNDRDEDSVEFIAATGNSIEDYPHHRFLCIQYPFGTNPKVHCFNCFCVVCEERASDCKQGDTEVAFQQ
jgi:hypothetical protein